MFLSHCFGEQIPPSLFLKCEQHVCYQICYSEKRLQGSVLPGKHKGGEQFSTEQLALIVRQRKRE
ncbi:hypothetical protein KDA_31200 [Dictyobacter alpinus]|uniref:Uncharacterized protein n=1 Tax=Dictyobacter alpinus TaxID=2014873 RepID=A0A402B8H7_9CHLR|nr:hypothetical protein KDA_31200 [Dictyobacter alpinus]